MRDDAKILGYPRQHHVSTRYFAKRYSGAVSTVPYKVRYNHLHTLTGV